ncbi:MAG: pyruvate dehydrogenase (acetyl-transferring) E1 component subunit alpha [Anaerolineae bacterium]|nr:pyruvate dehydrogenase (acetyl-transferring) E1 component subunit alpha [Anaerolineae bacterium]
MSFPLADTVHQVLTPEGEVVGQVPDLPAEQLLGFYRWMLFGRLFSDRMVALQRQGRMGTFGPVNGQEAASVGLAAPLQTKDWLTGSYREFLCYFVKGVAPIDIMRRYRGHIGVRYNAEARCLPTQIVLATQMLHAAGLAMAIKYDGQPNVAVGVCGDGATSEGDFNETLNFVAVFQAPMVIVVQNNGWAISTPRRYQTRAEFIAHRGPGFGLPGYVVDGNDVLAVYQVMAECVDRARNGGGPSLIEAITYRMGAHTTADDPTKYRPADELEAWRLRDPLTRYRTFLLARDILTESVENELQEAIKAEIQAAVDELDAYPPQDPNRMFDLVYETPTAQLEQQRAALLKSLQEG